MNVFDINILTTATSQSNSSMFIQLDQAHGWVGGKVQVSSRQMC